jgi:hypothetical protein
MRVDNCGLGEERPYGGGVRPRAIIQQRDPTRFGTAHVSPGLPEDGT